MIDYEKFEEYDKYKTKVLKYVLYKKRTESEIKKKFEKEIDPNMLDDIMDDLKENGYIDDSKYIERAINEFINLKSLSLKQIRYKLMGKGINNDLINEFFFNNEENLKKYEIKSINSIINKKNNESAEEIIQTLLKKGFEYDNVKEALERRDQ